MKLIIDIDEKDYKGIISHDYYGIYSGTVSRALYEATKIGKPLQAEFEEIKADIDGLYSDCLYGEQLVSKTETMKIIDNRISKLKGESNE